MQETEKQFPPYASLLQGWEVFAPLRLEDRQTDVFSNFRNSGRTLVVYECACVYARTKSSPSRLDRWFARSARSSPETSDD